MPTRHPLRRLPKLHVEPLEPRFLLSAELLVLPPEPQPHAPQPVLSVVDAAAGAHAQQAEARPDEVIFVDPGVAGYRSLIEKALANRGDAAAPAQVEVVVLDPTQDGIAQISGWLSQRRDLQAVHLIAHGGPGEFQLGTSSVDAAGLDARAEALASWRQALAAGADILVYGCDVAQGAAGAAFTARLAALTGADVAASTNATGAAALGGDWVLERSTGAIDSARVLRDAAYPELLAPGPASLVIGAGLQAQVLAVLGNVDTLATQALGNALVNQALPGLGDSVDKFIGLAAANGAASGVFKLQPTATAYFTAAGAGANLEGLATALQAALVTGLSTSGGQAWAVAVTPTYDPAAGAGIAGLKVSISLGSSGWTKTGLAFSTPASLAGWTGSAVSKVDIDIDAGWILASANSVPTDAQSFLRFNRFEVSTELSPSGSNGFHLVAGIAVTVKDADNSDGTSRVTLADLAVTGVAVALRPEMTASISGTSGATGFYGEVAGGSLTLRTFADGVLTATANGLTSVFNAVQNAGGQVDMLPTLNAKLPFVDTSFSQLEKTSDGRTLGDVLALRTSGGSNVVADYLGDTGVAAKTFSGLLQRIREYLTGSGFYAGLEAVAAASYATDFMRINASGLNGENARLNLSLSLSRDFLRRFTFNDKLKAVGLDFAPGSAVTLRSEIAIEFDFNTASATPVDITTFTARVSTPDTTLDTAVVLGILEGRAKGTVSFDTGTVTLAFGNRLTVGQGTHQALALADLMSVKAAGFDANRDFIAAVNGTPAVRGAANITLSGTIGAGTAGATDFVALDGAAPTVTATYAGGAAVAWTEAKDTSVVVTTDHFTSLQAFASLNATSLVRMLTDMGTYLQQLRDSGKFDAALPYTGLRVGDVLDFSAAFNDVVNNQLQYVLVSGITASRAISPVLAADASFDVQVTWPGDDRPSLVTVAVRASETAGFTDIRQLARLVAARIASTMDGNLLWMRDNAAAQAVVTRTAQGGIAINSALVSSEEQRLDVHALSGTFSVKLGADGTPGAALAVDATPAEVQAALEDLPGIGRGNVLVTGTPRHYVIDFMGLRASQSMPLLQATLSDTGAANAGGLLDVFASNTFTGTDGKVWGQLNIVQSVPGTLSDLRISATAGVALEVVAAGSATTGAAVNAVQRLTVVHGAGGTFTISGVKPDGTDFTTAGIAVGGNGLLSTRIQDAINTAMAVPGADGVVVSATDPNVVDVAQGVQSFDIVFSGAQVKERAFAAFAVNGASLLGAPQAQASVTTVQQAALAVQQTPGRNEIQRVSITNAAGGSVVFGITIGPRFYEANPIDAANLSAASIQATLLAMMRQWQPDFADGDLVVTAAPGRSQTWDVEFRGPWAAADVPQLKLDITNLVGQPDAAVYALPDKFGLNMNGQDAQDTGVTSFVSFDDLVERFQQAVNTNLQGSGLAFSVAPSYDNATRTLGFRLLLQQPSATIATPLATGTLVGQLSGLAMPANLEVTSTNRFEATVLFDLSNLNTFALRAGGAYTAVLAATGSGTAPFKVSSDAHFRLSFDGEAYDLLLKAQDTSTNLAHADLQADLQAVLAAQAVKPGGVLEGLGYATVGDAVSVQLDAGNRLQMVTHASVTTFVLAIPSAGDSMSAALGFRPMTMYLAPKLVTLPADGRLTGDATFELSIDHATAVSVTVTAASTAGNTGLADLLADINDAFAATSVAAHAYLGTGGLGLGTLADAVRVIVNANQLEIVTLSHRIASLQIGIPGSSTASSELGFTPGQSARASASAVMLQGAAVTGSWTGVVHGQQGAVPATLAVPGVAKLGMLDLRFGSVAAEYSGSMAFTLRNGPSGAAGDRVGLDKLFDAVSAQDSQLGLGGDLATSDSAVVTAAPVSSDGRLLRDVGLTVTVGTTSMDLVVRVADTAGNSSVADLAADVDAAIHAGLLARFGVDSYAGHVFVRVATGDEAGQLEFVAGDSVLGITTTPDQVYDSGGRLFIDVPLKVTNGATTVDVTLSARSSSVNGSVADLASQLLNAIGSAASSARANTTDAQALRDLGTIMAAVQFPIFNVDGVLTLSTIGDVAVTATQASAGSKMHDSAGRLLGDLQLTVRKGAAAVDFTVTAAQTQGFTQVDQLVAWVRASLGAAVDAAMAAAPGAQALADLTDLRLALAGLRVDATGGTLALGTRTVGSASIAVAGQPVTVRNLEVTGRTLVADYMTPVSFGATTPLAASLTLGALGVATPAGVSAAGLDPATTITLSVANLADSLGGLQLVNSVAVVPPDGLGLLTPFGSFTWDALAADLQALPALLSDLGNMGPLGQLGRNIPLLGQTLSELLNLPARLQAAQLSLAGAGAVSLQTLPAAIAAAFQVPESAVQLGMDATPGAQAVTIAFPLTVGGVTRQPLQVLLQDPDFLALLTAEDRARLMALSGSVDRLADDDGTALMAISGQYTLNLQLGLDISGGARSGHFFLVDHAAAGAEGLAGDAGTFAQFDLSGSGANMAFISNQGIYSIGVRGGSANVAESGSWVLDSGNKGFIDRLYLNDVAQLSTTADSALKHASFDVTIDTTSHAVASLPLTLVVSDELSQIAISEIRGFLNPQPLGTMDLAFNNLAGLYAVMGGGTAALDNQVLEAAKPPAPATAGNGTGDATAEGAPVDSADDKLPSVNLNPYVDSADGEGASTDAALPGGDGSGASGVPPVVLYGDGAPNASSAGKDLSYIIPDIGVWQDELEAVIEKALNTVSRPDKPVNYGLIFLLRDPTIIVDTVDKILGTVQKGLDAFSTVLDLPIIGDQLREATQFVADLREHMVGALRDALASSIDVYGGLDNALRMFLFNTLTTDINHDWRVTAEEVASNPFRNFIRDYNHDGFITPDDIVVEYIAGASTPQIDARAAKYLGMPQGGLVINNKQISLPGVIPGQRTGWVTSGMNVPTGKVYPDGGEEYTISAGNVVLDPKLRDIVDHITDTVSTSGEALVNLVTSLQATRSNGTPDSIQALAQLAIDAFTSGRPLNYDTILETAFGGSVGLVAMQQVALQFSKSPGAKADAIGALTANIKAGNYEVPVQVVTEFKEALYAKARQLATGMALQQSTAIQFRMQLGQTYTPSLNLGFDVGVPGLNLKLDGGVQLDMSWDFYLGFGVDIKQGFYLVTNMPANAGLGERTNLSADGTVPSDRYVVANRHDDHISNLWLVGKPGQVAEVKEIQFSIDVYLAPGADGGPASLGAEFLLLNGTLTDNWDGWIKDNDTGIWGQGTDSLTGAARDANYGRTREMFGGQTGAAGSRTHLHADFTVSLKDKGLFGISALSNFTDGRLTYSDIRSTRLADLVKVEWDAQAQVNLHMVLGISPGGEGYLPAIKGDFHLTWQGGNANKAVRQLNEFFSTGYDKLFHNQMSAWFSDVYLDVGTFFTQFLHPIADVIIDFTAPVMPVLDVLVRPIPGLSSFMGRNYSLLDLASDLSRQFGGYAKVDFIVAMVRMVEVMRHLPNTPGLLIPVSEILILAGRVDRKLNLSALNLPVPDVPVTLPYKKIASVDYAESGATFSLDMGVGWKNGSTTLTHILSGDIPDFSFDFDLSADMLVPAPYVTVEVIHFSIPGVSEPFTATVGFGWQNLKVSDILANRYAPSFDVTVTGPSINIALPPLQIKVPTLHARIFGADYTFTVPGADGNGYLPVRWPQPLAALQDNGKTPFTIVDLSASASFTLEIKPFLRPLVFEPPTVHWVALGKDFQWHSPDISAAQSSFNIKYAPFIDNSLTPVRITLPDVWLPAINLLDLLPNLNFSLSLPGLPSLPSINIDLPDLHLPGQTTIGPAQGLKNFKDTLHKPGSKLTFPILDDPTGAVIKMLMGKPADLMVFTPTPLDVKVGFRKSFPIYPPLFAGFGGEIRVQGALTLGFDTQGIADFFESKRIADMFNGFWISDNIVRGVDKPEITLTTKLYAYAELDLGFIRGGVEGGIKFLGTLDVYDEDKDNKFRANEILAALSDDPLDVVEMHLRGFAYIAAYVDLFAVFDWARIFEYTFVDITLFTWDHDPAANKPVLGSMDGDTLTLHMGNRIGSIDGNAAVTRGAADRLRRNTTDANESFRLSETGGVRIDAVLPNGQSYNKTFGGVRHVKAYGGAGDDVIDASALSSQVDVLFIAGGGHDLLKGGAGNDTLIGSADGEATLVGAAGNDVLVARGGLTHLDGGVGDDTYRMLPGWGQADITDTTGANVLDFRAQVAPVTIDDALHVALQDANLLQFHVDDSIDRIRGGAGKDVLDFSGDAANLLLTLTAINEGWVTASASGMLQTGLVAGSAQAAARDNAGFGFKFDGIENIIGGSGSDVFRIRAGAAVTGSLQGDTTGGLHAISTANAGDRPNARNTIDLSEFTVGVVINEENRSTFAGVSNIEVHGFHNIFGGSGNDMLLGDGRNNLIVGNGGIDAIEGKAGHDLLVADTFTTWRNELSTPVNPQPVTDYLSLQDAGIAAGFGGSGSSAGRMWIWKGQTLENKSLSPGRHILKGGTGNDIELGSLGGDVFDIGGAGEGDNTILGDLGQVVVDFASRSALNAKTYGQFGGGGDTIYLGSGSNLVLAGNGADFIQGQDDAGSTNIVLADNGEVKFKTAMLSLPTSGGTVQRTTFSAKDGFTHMLDTVTTVVGETAGADTVNLSNGSALVIGGGRGDTITFTAGTSTAKNFRFVAADHAQVRTDARGGVIVIETTDTLPATSGDDIVAVGNGADTSARFLGQNFVIGGYGADAVFVSASKDPDTGVITYGRAQSDDVILADNGRIDRYDSIVAASTPNLLKKVESTRFTDMSAGGDDTVIAGNGNKVVVGGFGKDGIQLAFYGEDAEAGTPQSKAVRIVAGDNARFDFDINGHFTDLVTLDTESATGGDDVIRIGRAGSTTDLGENYVFGGMGSDTILVTGRIDDADKSLKRGTATSEDIVLGDNGEVHRQAITNVMLSVFSTVVDKGAGDVISTGHGGKVIIGGVAGDQVQAADGTMLVFGDNAALTYDLAALNGVLRVAESTAIVLGGDDDIGLGEGFKLVSGGFGADQVRIDATSAGLVTGTALVTGLAAVLDPGTNRTEAKGRTGRVVAGDNLRAQFDVKGGLTDVTTTDVISATGGNDALTLGALDTEADLGWQLAFGGMGGDTITVRQGSTSDDVLFGDNGEYHRQPLGYGVLSAGSLAGDKGGDDTIRTGRGSKLVVGGFADDHIDVATTRASDTALVLGDSGVVTWDNGGGEVLARIDSSDLAFGGNDSVRTGSGRVVFVGGYGGDRLDVDANESNDRTAVGDNATLVFGTSAGGASVLTDLTTTDLSGATGDADQVSLGLAGSVTGDLGRAIVVGGMGADTLVMYGNRASSVLAGDNLDLHRTSEGRLLSITSLLLADGAGDTIRAANGDAVILGGAAGDTIDAGSGPAVVLGDSGSLVYGAAGGGILRLATSLGLGQGGDDAISLGRAAEADGDKFVIGGSGSDSVVLLSVAGSERAVAGDNAELNFDNSGRVVALGTLDVDLSTGGNDNVTIIMGGDPLPADPITDFNVVAGGVGNDAISIVGATRSRDVLAGDNLEYRRTDGSNADPAKRYVSVFADVLQPGTGGADVIRTGAGDKLVLGGAGDDSIETQTRASSDRNIVLADAGSVVLDPSGSGNIEVLVSTGENTGGNDSVRVGGGAGYVIGGAGRDTLTVNASDSANRILIGDDGQVDFDAGRSVRVQTPAEEDRDPDSSVDTFTVPSTGSNFVLGGPGMDELQGGSAGDALLPGSGSVAVGASPLNNVISVTVLGEWMEFGIKDLALVKPAASVPGDGGVGGTVAGQGTVGEDQALQANGKLSAIPFAEATLPGLYGTLSLQADGNWVYALANGSAAVQALKTGESRQDTFVIPRHDGSITVVDITVMGADDTAVVSGLTGASITAADPDPQGRLVVVDADAQESGFVASAQQGRYGTLALSRDGAWTYALDRSPANPVNLLAPGDSLVDAFNVQSLGGTQQPLSIRIGGVQGSSGSVGDDGASLARGRLAGAAPFVPAQVDGRYGRLVLDATGAWTYALASDAPAVQALHAGETAVETILVSTVDGLPREVRITVTGAADPAVLGGAFEGRVAANAPGAAAGRLTVSDPDHGEASFVPVQRIGNFGSFTLASDGQWSYLLDAGAPQVLALQLGEVRVERFTVLSADGTSAQVAIAVSALTMDLGSQPAFLSAAASLEAGVREPEPTPAAAVAVGDDPALPSANEGSQDSATDISGLGAGAEGLPAQATIGTVLAGSGSASVRQVRAVVPSVLSSPSAVLDLGSMFSQDGLLPTLPDAPQPALGPGVAQSSALPRPGSPEQETAAVADQPRIDWGAWAAPDSGDTPAAARSADVAAAVAADLPPAAAEPEATEAWPTVAAAGALLGRTVRWDAVARPAETSRRRLP